MISVTIPGPPCAQGRPRAVRAGSGVRMYQPPKSRAWREVARFHMSRACRKPLETPVSVSILAIFPCPNVFAGIRWRGWHAKRPDVDNLAKATLDAGNGVLWRDDAQVACLRIAKVIASGDERPAVHVEVRAMAESACSAWVPA